MTTNPSQFISEEIDLNTHIMWFEKSNKYIVVNDLLNNLILNRINSEKFPINSSLLEQNKINSEKLKPISDNIKNLLKKKTNTEKLPQIIAVSKTWPIEVISELVDCGHKVFGENKVQEIETKVPNMSSSLEWHFIGHLQRNKVRKVLPLVNMIHSVDSLQIAKRINDVASDLGLFPKVLLQVNNCLLYTSPSPRDKRQSRMPSSA